MFSKSKKNQPSQNKTQGGLYRRRDRKKQTNPAKTEETVDKEKEIIQVEKKDVNESKKERPVAIKVKSSHRSLIFLFSLIGAATSVALPYMTYFANSIQSQELYMGYMLSKGNLPYSSIYGTSGILYYAIIALAYLCGSSAWLALIQFVTQYLSGVYINKILLKLTEKDSVALLGTLLFSFAQLTIGFGGLYASQWALPTILLGLWFLIRYFENQKSDEWFIYYGVLSGISYFIDPKTIIFWLIALLIICLYNFRNKRYARGFYQFLAIVMGTILILYPSAYILLSMQVFNDFLSETGWLILLYPGLTNSNPWYTILIQAFFLVSIGAITIIRKGYFFVKTIQKDKWVQRLIFVTFTLLIPSTLFSQTYEPHTLLLILPFGLFSLLSFLATEPDKTEQLTTPQRSHRIRQSDFSVLSQKFYEVTRYMIVISMLVGVALAGYHVYNTQSLASERKLVTQSIKGAETIYAWDDTTQLYRTTKATSNVSLVLPQNYTGNATIRNTLVDSILEDKTDYIVVNKSISMSNTLKSHIEDKYEEVKVDKVKHYTIYKKK